MAAPEIDLRNKQPITEGERALPLSQVGKGAAPKVDLKNKQPINEGERLMPFS